MLPEDHSLTVCSVSFRSAPYLSLNWELTKQLNSGKVRWSWIVAENTPIQEDRLSEGDSRFHVVRGAESLVTGKYRGSYQHGETLNALLPLISTRFVLFLDPDFFIVRDEWMSEIITLMVQRRLTFFGAPWHPRSYRKYRYFPCVHCLFVDTSQVSLCDLDFRPDLLHNPPGFVSKFWQQYNGGDKSSQSAWKAVWTDWRRALREDWNQRRLIGTSRDTGIRIYEDFSGSSSVRHEEVAPVFRPHEELFTPRGVTSLQRSRFIERWLPDRLSYIPKRSRAFTGQGFRESGSPDWSSQGLEEFMWKGTPFGFHVRETLCAGTKDKAANLHRIGESLACRVKDSRLLRQV